MKMLSWCAGLAAAGMFCLGAQAAEAGAPAPANVADAAAAGKDGPQTPEGQVRARVQQRIGGKVDSVRRTPLGLYEVVVDNDILYVDEAVKYVVAGRLIDVRTHEDLTAARREEVQRVDFKTLPLERAVKSVHGDGSRVLVIFADPNCPYCKKLEKDINELPNTTLYTFLYPILSDDSVDRSRAIWCSSDRAAAWNALMVRGKAPDKAAADCKTPIDDNLELGHRLFVSATPTIIYTDGRRMPGAVPIDRIEAALAEAGKHEVK
jgi:thiol:disulfide interchange protein DsbC